MQLRGRIPGQGADRGSARTRAIAVAAFVLAVPALAVLVPSAASASSRFTPGEGTGTAWCPGYGGVNLGSYRDVYACAPKAKVKNAGKTPFDSYPGFQPTELANRFLYMVTGHTLFANENAGSWVRLAAAQFGIPAAASGSAARLPAAGDIISMWGGRSRQKQNGNRTEVAVVTGVTAAKSGWTITTLNQGDPSDTDGRKGFDTITVSANGRTWSALGGFYASFSWLKLAGSGSSPGGSGSGSGPGSVSWSATEAPGQAASQPGQLLAADCSAAADCTAAGAAGTSALLVYRSGSTWKAVTVPAPSTGASQMRIAAIACASPGTCLAAGTYRSQGQQQGVLLSGHGGAWTATRAPLPTGAAAHPHVVLTSVACPAASFCVAAGYYTAAAGTAEGLIVTGQDTSWTAHRAPLPPDARARPSAQLKAVACAGASHCAAVGGYYDTLGNQQGLIVTGGSGGWSAVRAALPPSAVTPGAVLASVACPGPGSCAAAGSFSARERAEVLTGWGSSWTATAIALPKDAAASPQATFRQIVCPATTECVAAGRYRAASGGNQGLLTGGHGTSWLVASAPLPAGAAADQNAPGAGLASVACPSVSSCVAAGQYTDTAGDARLLLLSWRNGTWTARSGPLPANHRTVGAQAQGSLGPPAFTAVTCPTTSDCLAVGSYPTVRAGMAGLLETGHS